MKKIIFLICWVLASVVQAKEETGVGLSKDFFYSIQDNCQTSEASLLVDNKISVKDSSFTVVCKKNPDKPMIVSCKVIDNKTKKGFNEFDYITELSLGNLTVFSAKEEKITQKVILNSKTNKVVLLMLRITGQDNVEQTICSGKIKNSF